MPDSSNALPSWMYRDPAEIVERLEMDDLGCKACSMSEMAFRVVCTDSRNEKQKGVPNIGHRCRWFRERGNS